MEQQDIIIIGAGISGLSLAHYCARAGLKTLVLEASARTGGCFHSCRFEGGAADFWIELGAHTCYNSYGNLIGILEDRGLLGRLVGREKVPFRLLMDDIIRTIPSQVGFAELLLSAPRLLTLKKSGLSIKDYYSGIVGRRNFERLFRYVFDAVISQEAGDFPADLLFKRRLRRKDVMKKFTFAGGVQSVTDALASMSDIKVLTGKEVGKIDFSEGDFNVGATDGSCYTAAALAIATPACSASVLLRTVFPAVSESLSGIRTNTIETVGIALEKEKVSIDPVAGIIAVNDSFYSAVSRDVVPHDKYRGFSFHFKPGVLDYEAKLLRIGRALKVSREDLKLVVSKENVVPGLRVGHKGIVEEVDKLIRGSRLLLTGNYFSGMAIEDCVSRSLGEMSRLSR